MTSSSSTPTPMRDEEDCAALSIRGRACTLSPGHDGRHRCKGVEWSQSPPAAVALISGLQQMLTVRTDPFGCPNCGAPTGGNPCTNGYGGGPSCADVLAEEDDDQAMKNPDMMQAYRQRTDGEVPR